MNRTALVASFGLTMIIGFYAYMIVGVAVSVSVSNKAPTPVPTVSDAGSAPSIPDAAPPPQTAEPPVTSSCPADMVEVEGTYCFKQSYTCLKSFVGDDRTNKDWYNQCYSYVEGSAKCSQERTAINLAISTVRGDNNGKHKVEPDSPLAKAMIGKRVGDEVLGCRVAIVNGAKVGRAVVGSSLKLDCPATLPVHFCIDRYEYPNVKGGLPARYYSWHDAKKMCAAEGKRLCYEHEWTVAAQGKTPQPYPYGWQRDNTACNISRCFGFCEEKDRTPEGRCIAFDPFEGRKVERPMCPALPDWMAKGIPNISRELIDETVDRLDRVSDTETFAAASGSMPRCVSSYGVYDTTGNVDEWTQCFDHCESYPSNLKGGHYANNCRGRTDPVTVDHGPAFRMPTIGFRCCSDISE